MPMRAGSTTGRIDRSVVAGLMQPPIGRCPDQRRSRPDPIKRGIAILVPRRGIGPGLKQRGYGIGIALLRSPVQRGEAIIIAPRLGIGPGPQAGSHIPGAGRLEERLTVPGRAIRQGLRRRQGLTGRHSQPGCQGR